MTTPTIRTLADLDHHLDIHDITLTPTHDNRIHAAGTTIPDHIRTWIADHRTQVLDWLAFRCECGYDAAVFDTQGTPWCDEHMPDTDPAIRRALVTLAQLRPTLQETA